MIAESKFVEIDGNTFWEVTTSNGTRIWKKNTVYRRYDGPAIDWASGRQDWYFNGKRHREDGPAIEHANGDKSWYWEGNRHRTDGPAVKWVNQTEWYLYGSCYSFEEYVKAAKWTDEQIVMYKLEFG